MNKENKKVVTRFAPSPTGYMHIGGVRTALYAWAYARGHDGKFILRIEDTDKEREVEGSIDHIIESLKWLGISWDEGPDIGGEHAPYIQSQRLESYKKYAQILIDKGFAYADPYSQEQLTSFRKKAEEEKRPFLYRDHRPENPPVWDGTVPLRFKVKDIKSYEWHDEVRGDLKAGPEALDDFILVKSDGYPTYNFAHIIDDLEMGVTHIMRADEFISSTPKFLALYDALEIQRPYLATLPPILGEGGNKKLGKRDGAKDVLDYREEGYLPEAILNFLVFIGWNPGDETEIITPEEFIKLFDLSKVQHKGGQYNEEKLDWINKEHLKKLSYEQQEEYISKFIPLNIKNLKNYSNEILHNITPLIIERISKGSEIREMADSGELSYFFEEPVYKKESLCFKNSKIEDKVLSGYLDKILKILESIDDSLFKKEHIKDSIMPFATEVGRGEVLWPIRYALSGLDKSPDPFTLSEVLGKKETINRLNKAISMLA